MNIAKQQHGQVAVREGVRFLSMLATLVFAAAWTPSTRVISTSTRSAISKAVSSPLTNDASNVVQFCICEGTTSLHVRHYYERRFVSPGLYVPCVALTAIDGAERADLALRALCALRCAAAESGHVLIIESAVTATMLALVKALNGEQLPPRTCADYYVPPPGRRSSAPPFGFTAAWRERAVSA